MDSITRNIPDQYLDLKSEPSTRAARSPVPETGTADAAFAFLQQQRDMHGNTASVNEKDLLRKIDFRIVPIMFACYTMQFIDKVNINYAAVMGLNEDLHLQGNEFSWCATAFFCAFLAAEIPTGFFLQKIPAAKYLGFSVIMWGVTTACTAACRNFVGLLIARIVLGALEAAIAPCLILITSMWYTKSEQVPRMSLWYSGLGIGQIFGGLVSYSFQHVESSFAGWRVMFLVLGGVTMAIGVWTVWRLPDTPMSSTWLTEQERLAVLERVAKNQTGISSTEFKPKQLKELLLDPQIWALFLCTCLISISSGVITTYSATVIRGFGYTPKITALLNMPSGIVSILSTVISGVIVGNSSTRSLWIAGLCVPGIVGGALMSFLSPGQHKAGNLIGIYLVNAVTATLILLYSWLAANVAGHTKRIAASVMISGSFSIGNIIGPMTFQARDAPGYFPAKITVLASQGAGAFVALLLRFYYDYENRRRDIVERENAAEDKSDNLSQVEWMNFTDKENTTFRYAL
ncbi:Sialin [Dactylellina cionopaga]|nr:Sialin [Dactylellina cionopaga]